MEVLDENNKVYPDQERWMGVIEMERWLGVREMERWKDEWEQERVPAR